LLKQDQVDDKNKETWHPPKQGTVIEKEQNNSVRRIGKTVWKGSTQAKLTGGAPAFRKRKA